jgi:hypothetical protein
VRVPWAHLEEGVVVEPQQELAQEGRALAARQLGAAQNGVQRVAALGEVLRNLVQAAGRGGACGGVVVLLQEGGQLPAQGHDAVQDAPDAAHVQERLAHQSRQIPAAQPGRGRVKAREGVGRQQSKGDTCYGWRYSRHAKVRQPSSANWQLCSQVPIVEMLSGPLKRRAFLLWLLKKDWPPKEYTSCCPFGVSPTVDVQRRFRVWCFLPRDESKPRMNWACGHSLLVEAGEVRKVFGRLDPLLEHRILRLDHVHLQQASDCVRDDVGETVGLSHSNTWARE